MRRIGTILLVVSVVGVCVLAALVRFTRDDVGDGHVLAPGESSVEAGFARDMAAHHSQGVEMADLIRVRTADPSLTALAADIVLSQQDQRGRFYGWLDQWNLPTISPVPMAWMDAAHTDTSMAVPGMATRDEVQALTDLPVAAAEVQFLRLMIRHHRGGLEMAERVMELTQRPEVVRAADVVRTSHAAEIVAMNDMLRARGEPPA